MVLLHFLYSLAAHLHLSLSRLVVGHEESESTRINISINTWCGVCLCTLMILFCCASQPAHFLRVWSRITRGDLSIQTHTHGSVALWYLRYFLLPVLLQHVSSHCWPSVVSLSGMLMIPASPSSPVGYCLRCRCISFFICLLYSRQVPRPPFRRALLDCSAM